MFTVSRGLKQSAWINLGRRSLPLRLLCVHLISGWGLRAESDPVLSRIPISNLDQSDMRKVNGSSMLASRTLRGQRSLIASSFETPVLVCSPEFQGCNTRIAKTLRVGKITLHCLVLPRAAYFVCIKTCSFRLPRQAAEDSQLPTCLCDVTFALFSKRVNEIRRRTSGTWTKMGGIGCLFCCCTLYQHQISRAVTAGLFSLRMFASNRAHDAIKLRFVGIRWRCREV